MQQTIAFSDEIQQEDIAVCEQVQRGLRSRSYDRGRFSALRENGVLHFQSLVSEFLKGGKAAKRRAARYVVAIGRVKWKSDPLPWSLSTQIFPPCSSTI